MDLLEYSLFPAEITMLLERGGGRLIFELWTNLRGWDKIFESSDNFF